MGRPRGLTNRGPHKHKPPKRKRVTVDLLERMHSGKITEPYQIMEKLLATVHTRLDGVKIAVAYRLGWRANVDGQLKIGQCQKRGDLDRALREFDFVLLLNKEAWATMDNAQKQALVDHVLCHAALRLEKTGEPKRDDHGRLVCRIRRHDVEEFQEVVDRHGLYTSALSGLVLAARADGTVQAALNDEERPIVQASEAAEKAEALSPLLLARCDRPVSSLNIPIRAQRLLQKAGIRTAGDLADRTSSINWWKKIKGMTDAWVQACIDALPDCSKPN